MDFNTAQENTDSVQQSDSAPATDAPTPPMNVQVVERLTDADKNALDMIKVKRELALANAKAALAQSESAELSYNNLVLQLAMRYRLFDGDLINEDGSIVRKSQGQ